MRDAYRSLLIVLGAVLALWLILGFWSLSISSQVALSVLVVLISGGAFWRQRRISKTWTEAAGDVAEDNLPPVDFQGAIILVCGDNMPLFAPEIHHRETRQGWYLRIKDAEQLPLIARHLIQMRPALLSQVSLLLALVPEHHTSVDDFTQCLRGWQRAVMHCRTDFSKPVPLWAVTWVSPPLACADAEPAWFTTVNGRPEIEVYQSGLGNLPLQEWIRERDTGARFSRLSQGLWLDSLLAWQNTVARQGEHPDITPCIQGLCLSPVNGIAGNLWQQHIASVTALSPDVVVTAERLPLPEHMLRALPRWHGISHRMMFWNRAGLLGIVFLALAMLASWTNNQRLIRNIGDRLAVYHHLTGNPVEPKLLAQQRLHADGVRLDDWRRRGEPMRYSLGLYQGLRLIPIIEAAINGWAPPQPDVPVIKHNVQEAKTLRLDSMSLFDTGKSDLKTGSTKMLINSLVGIKARPGWLIVVAGHTDNTGNPQLNQALSLKRAEAVRNWMRDTGDVPESCFAVQGYAASRPVASNDTPEGRALNRRVEISLVPQADACLVPDLSSASPAKGDALTQEMEK